MTKKVPYRRAPYSYDEILKLVPEEWTSPEDMAKAMGTRNIGRVRIVLGEAKRKGDVESRYDPESNSPDHWTYRKTRRTTSTGGQWL